MRSQLMAWLLKRAIPNFPSRSVTPRAGTVHGIRVKESDLVQEGETLVVLALSSGPPLAKRQTHQPKSVRCSFKPAEVLVPQLLVHQRLDVVSR